MLGRLKNYSFSELRVALLKVDDFIMTENVVKQFLNFAPTPEEVGLLSSYKDNPENLGRVEAFFVEVSGIAGLWLNYAINAKFEPF